MNRLGHLILSLLVVAALGCSSSAPKHEEKPKLSMEPSSGDALQPLMSKTQANLDYLIYGLMNFDAVKVEKSVGNLAAITQYTAKLTNYQHKGSSAEWEALCQDQEQAIYDIKQSYLSEDYTAAAASLGRMLAACVQCHKPYRFNK